MGYNSISSLDHRGGGSRGTDVNMNKLIVSWFAMYAINILLSSIFQGGGGLVATTLTSPLSATDSATINVVSTAAYRNTDIVYIENEQIRYSGNTSNTFTGLTRAINRTHASAHATGTPVYSLEMGTINQASGAFVAESDVSGGQIGAAGFNIGFLIRAIPNMVTWPYPYFTGQLVYLRLLLQMVGVGLTVSLVLATVNVFTKVFS